MHQEEDAVSTRKLPSYATLTPNYPTGDDPEAVKQDIGGAVDEDWITNTCVVRISKAFNYVGDKKYEIPRTNGLLTVKGRDQKNYAIRVAEFIGFLRNQYGPPDIVREGDEISVDPFRDMTGIIAWHVSGWRDATGHFTLWDGAKGLYEGDHHYFELPTAKPDNGPWVTKVEFWRC
jgi:hypothetical protein